MAATKTPPAQQTMGAGTFSIVRSCVSKENGQSYALKIIDKSSVGEQTKMLKREVDILSGVEHPNVVRLFEIYESSAKLFLVMELVRCVDEWWLVRCFGSVVGACFKGCCLFVS